MDDALAHLDWLASQWEGTEARPLAVLIRAVTRSARVGLPPEQLARTLDSLSEVYVTMQARIQRDKSVRLN